MKITRYLIASSAVALSLLVASPALADSQVSLNGSVGSNSYLGLHHDSVARLHDNRDGNAHSKVTIAGTVSAINGSTLTLAGRNGTTYAITVASALISNHNETIALSEIQVGDMLVVKGTISGSTITASKIRDTSFARRAFLSAIGAADAGVVTSINGSLFTLGSFGTSGTTTIATNASTTYKVNGVATTSSALAVGSRLIVFGTPDSTGITASLVSILNAGFGFMVHFFR